MIKSEVDMNIVSDVTSLAITELERLH